MSLLRKASGIAGSALSGAFISGLQWPLLFPYAFIAGLFAGRRVNSRNTSPLILFLILSTSIIYFLNAPAFSYGILYGINPSYFVTSIILGIIAIILSAFERTFFGFAIFFIAIIPGQLAYSETPLTLALILGGILVSHFSGTLRKLQPASAGLTIFHAYLLIGLFALRGGNIGPSNIESLTEKTVTTRTTVAEQVELYRALEERVVSFFGYSEKEFKKGNNHFHIQHSASPGSVYIVRQGEDRIEELDTESFDTKRQSFQGIVYGENTRFSISPDGKFIAAFYMGKVVLVYVEMLEWLDTLNLGTGTFSDITFGKPGTLYVSDSATGVIYKLEYDRFGHGLSISNELEAGVGFFSLAYIEDKSILIAANYFLGGSIVIDADSFEVRAESVFPVEAGVKDVFSDGENALFVIRGRVGEAQHNVVYKLDDLIKGNEQAVHKFPSFLSMPVKAARSTR